MTEGAAGSMDVQARERRMGIVQVTAAYTAWGLLPLYWKLLKTVAPPEILTHRIVWSFLLLALIVTMREEWHRVRNAFQPLRSRLLIVATALLLGANWLLYITAINTDHVVESSLGYYINPMVSVLLGVLVLRERLEPRHWAAVALAAVGVGWLTFRFGRVPWFALGLALTFGAYGLLRKIARVGALTGLLAETGLLSPAALIYVALLSARGAAATGTASVGIHALLIFAGVVTSVPLLLFLAGVRRIPLSLAGFLQYISPTFQFLLGVFVFGEPFTIDHLAAFGLIWIGLLLFSLPERAVIEAPPGVG
jgi:chloramphenicol-sensitive protein RarD